MRRSQARGRPLLAALPAPVARLGRSEQLGPERHELGARGLGQQRAQLLEQEARLRRPRPAELRAARHPLGAKGAARRCHRAVGAHRVGAVAGGIGTISLPRWRQRPRLVRRFQDGRLGLGTRASQRLGARLEVLREVLEPAQHVSRAKRAREERRLQRGERPNQWREVMASISGGRCWPQVKWREVMASINGGR